MKSPLARGLIALAAVAAVVVLFVVLAGGDDDSADKTTTTQAQATTGTTGATGQEQPQPKPAQPAVERIVIVNGNPRGGVQRLSFNSGDRIQFVVQSDVADEVHVHGYDISRDVPAGGSVRFGFPARLEGVFEVELETRHEQIAGLRINP